MELLCRPDHRQNISQWVLGVRTCEDAFLISAIHSIRLWEFCSEYDWCANILCFGLSNIFNEFSFSAPTPRPTPRTNRWIF